MNWTENAKRLIVLVPDYRQNRVELAQKVYWLATRADCSVLYLTLTQDGQEPLALARSMTTLVAQTAGTWLPVAWENASAADWLSALQSVYRPGDRVVCHAGQTAQAGLLRQTPLSAQIEGRLGLQTLTISGFYQPAKSERWGLSWQKGLPAWLGFFVIIALFTWLEVALDLEVGGMAGRILLIIVMMMEFGAVLAWNQVS